MIDMKHYILKRNLGYRQVENFIFLLQKNAIEYALGDITPEIFVENQKMICREMNKIFDEMKNANRI
jgi:hypothetical protein